MISTIVSDAESLGTRITSDGGSIFTVVWHTFQLCPKVVKLIRTQVTSNGGQVVSTIVSGAESFGTRVTSFGGSEYTASSTQTPYQAFN